jgi:hypothetical protein
MPENQNNSAEDQHTRHHTLFDDVFKTQCNYMLPLLIPIVNEMFGTDYKFDEAEIEQYANEHIKMPVSEDTAPKIPKVISDSYIKLNDIIYHIECQSNSDGSILFRILDYNMQIALENRFLDDTNDTLDVQLPHSALLMLRQTNDHEPQKTEKKIRYRYQDQSINMIIPVMHVQGYSMKEIFEKNLYFLIPFFPLRYEKALEQIAENHLENPDKYDKIYSELKVFSELFYDAYKHNKLSEYITRELAVLCRKVINLISDKLDDEHKERLVNTMDGQVLELQCQKWFREGREEGKLEEQQNTERERKRADQAENELSLARAYIKELEEKYQIKSD